VLVPLLPSMVKKIVWAGSQLIFAGVPGYLAFRHCEPYRPAGFEDLCRGLRIGSAHGSEPR
jgi:hypothetical protein